MSSEKFLHELPDFKTLIEQVSRSKGIASQLVEKDYWIMHCLWGLKKQRFEFELKGGTSLSKGFGIISRFSEDIDIRIEPPDHMDVKTGRNHTRQSHVESRFKFYDWLTENISISGIKCERETSFDDSKARSAGVALHYQGEYPQVEGIKPYVLLEVGFDLTCPNSQLDISSWVLDRSMEFDVEFINNRALQVPCYHPGYTLVEKLSAISRYYRQERAEDRDILPVNFIRHYYDVYELLGNEQVQAFIGTLEYFEHKKVRFSESDEQNLRKNEAFSLNDKEVRTRYAEDFEKTKVLYYDETPDFDALLSRIAKYVPKL